MYGVPTPRTIGKKHFHIECTHALTHSANHFFMEEKKVPSSMHSERLEIDLDRHADLLLSHRGRRLLLQCVPARTGKYGDRPPGTDGMSVIFSCF